MFPKLQTKYCLILLICLLSLCITSVRARVLGIPYALLSDTVTKPLPPEAKGNKVSLTSIIEYSAKDSIIEDVTNKAIWLYGNANIKYGDTKIADAAVIKIDLKTNTLSAYESTDSIGNRTGVPQITQGSESFKAKNLSFNFTSKKILVHNVIYKEGEGYLHGSVVKKVNDTVTNVGRGMYTTCDLEEHPHFALKFSRAKVISQNKIITGPVVLTIEDVPLPIVLPFGIFPNKRGRSSGLIMPRWGEMANRGFYLQDGGYYFGLSDYFDLRLTGDIYTRGSWAIKPLINYSKRYKFSGSFDFNYAVNVFGVKGTSDYSKGKDFFITWSHRQDPKARPNSVFSASVRAGSSKYNRYSPLSFNDYITNTFSSSITYDRRFGDFGNLTTSLRHNQNTTTHAVSLSLPEASFNVNRIYPFKRKHTVGDMKWYEKISLAYNMNLRNEVNTYDSLLFSRDIFNKMMSGVQHTVPISASFNIFKYFNWSNSINYNERWYLKTIRKHWSPDTVYVNGKMFPGMVITDTINGFMAARDYNFSSSIGTTLYGTKLFKKGFLKGIRHVIRPSVGFSFTPNFGSERLGYWKTVQTDNTGRTEKYSVFGGSGTFYPLFGTPPMQKSGAITFNVGNNLEAKIASKRDSTGEGQKIVLIDNLSLSTSYDLARDSLRWAPISISAYTTLFKRVQLNFSASLDLYHYDEKGHRVNKFEYEVSKRLFNLTNSGWNLSFSYDLNPKSNNNQHSHTHNHAMHEHEEEYLYELADINSNGLFIDWNNPWSLRFSYNLAYNSYLTYNPRKMDRKISTNTLSLDGSISITEKWKLTAQSGYDFKQKEFTYTRLSIARDLHCWEMNFSWVPYGPMKQWNFKINVRANTLKDLKLEKRKDSRSYY